MTRTTSTTTDLVELVAPDGTPLGSAPRLSVHTTDTPLHRAFSIYLFNADHQVLMTRRALSKATWPGVWTNACCGHPRPGETTVDAVRRRVREELGAEVLCEAVALPDFAYRAVDASGLVENELCPVYLGAVVDDRLDPDPSEVMEHRWMEWPRLAEGVKATPEMFSPWAALQIPQLDEQLPRWPAAMTSAPNTAGVTLDAVDELLARGAAELAGMWRGSIEPGPTDVVGRDLPDQLGDLVRGGGKRIRPTMCHWGYVASGGKIGGPRYADVVRVAAALEMLHTFALVHDDVMDESDTRRGRPSAHIVAAAAHRATHSHGDADVFGANVAILLGDLAHAEADRLVSTLPDELRRQWFELCVELIAGQRADLTGAAAGRFDLAHASLVARLKSGAYTVERPLLLGATAAGAGPSARDALATYGRQLGHAFALRDDVLGVWGDPAVTGKPAGDDLRSGKATVILALARGRLRGEGARAIDRVATPEARDGDVALLQAALTEAGVRDRVESLITEAHDQAIAALELADLDPGGVDGLRDVARRISWRDR
ncbi:hypothetical protein GCM10027418_07500 [Mariniluteicoccus endophyticus]